VCVGLDSVLSRQRLCRLRRCTVAFLKGNDMIWLPFQANPELNEDLHTEWPLTFMMDHRPETKQFRSMVWHLTYRLLKPGDWKKLAEQWDFTKEQVDAIEAQWTGASTATTPNPLQGPPGPALSLLAVTRWVVKLKAGKQEEKKATEHENNVDPVLPEAKINLVIFLEPIGAHTLICNTPSLSVGHFHGLLSRKQK